MKAFTKIISAAVAAASIAAFAVPANATISIGLQEAGVNGGAITTVATGATFASFADSYGTFELTFTSGAQGLTPILLGSTSHVQNTTSTGGTLDVYVTRTNISGPVPLGFFSSFTSNTLPTGWTLTESTWVDLANGTYTGTEVSNHVFNGPIINDTFEHTGTAGAGAGQYSLTQRYTITATGVGESLATISTAAIPEPATWGLMIMGFGGIGALVRNRRRQTAAFA